MYHLYLKGFGSFTLPPKQTAYCENIYWVFGIISKDKSRDAKRWMTELAEQGIGTRPFFYPMHLQPVLQNGSQPRSKFPHSEKISKYGLYLPSGITLKENEIFAVCKKLIG